jgi:hypothetical protein
LKYYNQFLPSIDGKFMPAHPVELFDQGKQIPVPLLMGGELILLLFEMTIVS